MREDIYQKLNKIVEQKEYSLLEKECHLLLSSYPQDVILLQLLGLAYTNLNKIDKAEQTFLSIVKMQSKSVSAHLNIARFYKFRKNFELSMKYYSRCLELSNNDYLISNEVAEYLILCLKFDEAETLLINTISKNKYKETSYFNLGILYLKKNSLLTALNFFNEAEQCNQENLNIKKYILYLLSKLEKRDEIVNRCVYLIKQKPNFLDSYIYLINAYVAKGDKSNARQYLSEGIAISPHHPELIRLNVLLNKIDDTSEYLVKIISYFEKSLNIEDKIIYGYAVTKVFEDNQNYEKSSIWIKKSNKLKEQTYSNYKLEMHLSQFDNLINFFQEHYDQIKLKKSKQVKKPIFIVGMPRSGSTLVEQILSSHSKISSTGETSAFPDSVEKIVKATDIKIFCDILKNSNTQLFQDIGNQYLKEIETTNASSKMFFTDKMLLNFKLLPLIKLCFPESKIIHCSRNSKDVCTSILKTNFEGYLPWAYNEKSIVRFYGKYQETMKLYRYLLANEIYEISYEKLVNNHESEIYKLINFCDLELEDNCYKFFENKREVNTASVFQVRNRIYNSSIGYWKNFAPYFSNMYENLDKI